VFSFVDPTLLLIDVFLLAYKHEKDSKQVSGQNQNNEHSEVVNNVGNTLFLDALIKQLNDEVVEVVLVLSNFNELEVP
jgi:hypothetical protein